MTTVNDMSTPPPFGFGFGDAPSGDDDGEGNNLPDFSAFGPMFAQLQHLFTQQSSGPVNWDLARQLATSTLGGASAAVGPAEAGAIEAAVRLADLWLDEATTLPSGVERTEGWTRQEWIERTLPIWTALCDPVAERVTTAMGSAIEGQLGQLSDSGELPAELRAFGFGPGVPGSGNPLGGIMSQVGGLMFGAQVGQGLGALSQEVVSASDVGVPLGPPGVAALVPQNVAAFGEGLERPSDEVRLYLALREAAHQRLFSHVPWLRQRLLDTVAAYARGITVDMSAIESAVSQIDPTDPNSVQEALAGGMFEPQATPEQQTALRRLETLLALVEGWVDTVVAAAAGSRMPGADALREASRRRRATGGPAEQTFATLVGLELRPRRLREAAALWWAVAEKHGVEGRDGLWAHPDLLPTPDDLDDPIGFAETVGAADGIDLGDLEG